eukprot:GHVH01000772.1.p1 GENE.GHVH01000772.1~~GHVH01000772.1.p1  ORF type:complete len:1551 (+),score=245.37 GHVH01000772.1:56-4708(+)
MSRSSDRRQAKLVLADGTEFPGLSFGYHAHTTGEVCFNTGMVGYTESLTDPSYCGQILVFTFPLLGNYGVPDHEDGRNMGFESDGVQVRAMICSSVTKGSHYKLKQDLDSYLVESKIPALCDVDTRALTKHIRDHGAQMGQIVVEGTKESLHDSMADVNLTNLVDIVTSDVVRTLTNYSDEDVNEEDIVHVVVVDCGIKRNILRIFENTPSSDFKLKITVVPWSYPFADIEYDGLFLSNGPGDPALLGSLVSETRKCMASGKPIFGVCLGNQILALSSNAKTYKMKFGHRGMNQPVMDMRTSRTYISSQNHGFAVDNASLSSEWMPFFCNVNDGTNEGIMHVSRPWYSVQFHPEGSAGPRDTSYLFTDFIRRCAQPNYQRAYIVPFHMPEHPLKVLILGSGGLSIGQAGEFDYSGSQALKALKENNIKTILINSNIATVQTSCGMADKVYFLPTTPMFVEKVIKRERPSAILCTFGGQTALNCAVDLFKSGTLARYGVQVLGTSIETIMATEDREVFSKQLAAIGERCAPSITATTLEGSLTAANEIGYPVLVRSAYSLGGLGSGFATNDAELILLCSDAFHLSAQVIIDKSLKGWKEVEYEVVRDKKANCVTVCNMENFDPLGVHTGDSIVVAPSQTLSNEEYYMLRDASLRVIEHLGVVGECNVQFALNPESQEYVIVEVNARLSRSSALASKATGYPLAYVAANLALGYDLPTLRNKVTLCTTACFEPALDYVVTKVPRWDLRKFENVSLDLGSSMKSVGEVMAIGRSWEESLQKALRMVSDNQVGGFECPPELRSLCPAREDLEKNLREPTCDRLWLIAEAFENNFSVDEIHNLTMIDHWFLNCLENIHKDKLMLRELGGIENVSKKIMIRVKKDGFSDKQISRLVNSTESSVRSHRSYTLKVHPFVKQVDTLAGEYPAQTNYLYLTYHAQESDVTSLNLLQCSPPPTPHNPSTVVAPRTRTPVLVDAPSVIVLGCGCYRIGSSVEFDWSCMSAVKTLRSLAHKAIVINSNPETVSTDYDESDRLYFEDSGNLETVLNICEFERPSGVIVSVGGQTPNNIAIKLSSFNIPVLGTCPSSIDCAEDRGKFSSLCDSLNIDQPAWSTFSEMRDAYTFCERVGYPVLVRPSYVLSGAAMNVVWKKDDLENLLNTATVVSPDHQVVISKYIVGAKEVEMDAVADNGRIVIHAISEHVENAGVHSGDATLILPAQKLYTETISRVRRISQKIALALNITGPFNIQYMCRDNDVKVIECNLRASRTFPFISKTFDQNFIEIATKAMLGVPYSNYHFNILDINYVGVKAPMFSFTRLRGADPRLGVEMRSTGEVACYGINKHEAFLKSWLSANQQSKGIDDIKAVLISVGPGKAKDEMMQWIQDFVSMDVVVYCTDNTYRYIMNHSEPDISLGSFQKYFKLCLKENEAAIDGTPYAKELIESNTVQVVINIPGDHGSTSENPLSAGFSIRRTAADIGVPLMTDIKLTCMFVESISRKHRRESAGKPFWDIRSWDEIVISKQDIMETPRVRDVTRRDSLTVLQSPHITHSLKKLI